MGGGAGCRGGPGVSVRSCRHKRQIAKSRCCKPIIATGWYCSCRVCNIGRLFTESHSGKPFEVTKYSRMWLPLPAGPSSVTECLKQRESSKRDEKKSSGAVAQSFESPSFVRTWMKKEPRQCPCVESTPTSDAGRPNYRSRLGREREQGGRTSSAECHLRRVSQSSRCEREANPCEVRHQPCALPCERRVFVELPDDEKERLARENEHDVEYVG